MAGYGPDKSTKTYTDACRQRKTLRQATRKIWGKVTVKTMARTEYSLRLLANMKIVQRIVIDDDTYWETVP